MENEIQEWMNWRENICALVDSMPRSNARLALLEELVEALRAYNLLKTIKENLK